jgi:sulfofructose kinase
MEKRPQVVGLGMATLDVLLRLKDMPTWDRGARLSDFGFDGGGPVGTAIVAAAKLGVLAGFIGTAGDDTAAELKLRSFVIAGVDLSRVVRREAPEDQIIIVHVQEGSGERVFSGVSRPTDAKLLPRELDRAYITSADYLHLDGWHAEAALQAAKWMQEAGKTVVLDGSKTTGPVRGSRRELVEHVDVLISGSGFVQGVTGLDDRWAALEAVLELGPRIAVQTEGELGSYTVSRTPHLGVDRFHMPAFPCDVLDTTGAGDVFHGAFIVGMIHDWPLRDIVRFATAVSAIKCTRLGGRAGIPDFDEVMVFLAERGCVLG